MAVVMLKPVAMVIVNVRLPVIGGVEESAACAVIGNVPAVVGVPLRIPLLALRVSPGGSPVADQVYGGVPPAAEN